MNQVDQEALRQDVVERVMQTTRKYLSLPERESATAGARFNREPDPGSQAAQARFVARASGHFQRLRRQSPKRNPDALQELERTFYLQARLISWYPETPRRLLSWLLQDGDNRARRRVQKVIRRHESRVTRIIGDAKQQGLLRAEVEPQTAASLFIGMLQGLALRMGGDARERELLLRAALDMFAAYKTRLACA